MRMGGGMYSTRSAPADDSEASLWACRGFLGLNISLASLGAWEKGLLVFALASLALAAAGFLLTQSLSRFLAALSSGALRHAGQIALLGAGFLSLEAVLIHHGLALLDAQHDTQPLLRAVPKQRQARRLERSALLGRDTQAA